MVSVGDVSRHKCSETVSEVDWDDACEIVVCVSISMYVCVCSVYMCVGNLWRDAVYACHCKSQEHTNTHTHTHTRTHTHTHTHTHTQKMYTGATNQIYAWCKYTIDR
jgi:hypothetical protein